ncbi:Wzz/FepE/Etk N-terminal domain-containing protein [Enterovibrio sp. ZSDZ42]|uniref:Wzz/FepE/Etk N-terminal domain-containing protein n=1 Tax=Enterovibrio gelatinilyticus TaxID=2899819 RepID=A0ABT5R476_9GAMM|nr:Wzz/FepE/Etk N-terminal domain-containing protein [Enterovibrio sp. ZSDZ42]MDD1794665.1 Wzz/FepE/Etk N-terminal domain-containing protein [Enterovibrio sp. ZSDZ42]
MNTLTYKLLILLDGAWRRRYVIMMPIIIFPLMGTAIGLITPKKYNSHTTMLIQETSKMNPFLEDLSVSSQMKERFSGLQTLLHSRHILGKVALDQGMIDADSDPVTVDETIAKLSYGLTMSTIGKDVIRIEYRSSTPKGMKETLQIVSDHVIEELLAPERSSMKDSSEFLAEHITYRREELDKAEAALSDFRSKHADGLPELQIANYARIEQLKQRLSEKQAEMAGARRSLGGLDEQLSSTNPVIGKIEDQIVKHRSELAMLKARYTDQHSLVQGALRNLRRLEEQRTQLLSSTQQPVDTDKLWDIASSTTIDSSQETQPLLISQLENLQLARSKVETLDEETVSLRAMIATLEEKTSQSGGKEQKIRKLERDLEVKRQLFQELLERHEMARLTSSLGVFEQDKRIKIIDRPYSPGVPSNLPLIIFTIAGLIGGVFLGCGMALILELTDTTIRRVATLEAITGTPVLTRVPRIAAEFPPLASNTGTPPSSGKIIDIN